MPFLIITTQAFLLLEETTICFRQLRMFQQHHGQSTNTNIFQRGFLTMRSFYSYLWNFVIYLSFKCGENFMATLQF
jgi:hypothetical protein